MSFSIDDRCITGILAFDRWFNVKKGSVIIDAYAFRYWEQNPKLDDNYDDYHFTDYQMGAHYVAQHACGTYGGDPKRKWMNPSGPTGICFIDADTNERVIFSLLEVKAFREMRP